MAKEAKDLLNASIIDTSLEVGEIHFGKHVSVIPRFDGYYHVLTALSAML